MSLTTREQKAVMTDFAGDGPFGPFGRQKDMKERLEENASEQLRLRITDCDYLSQLPYSTTLFITSSCTNRTFRGRVPLSFQYPAPP